ncbi:hypothetical protein BH24GEM1_BH24GEM1_23670 [soil metagenome]
MVTRILLAAALLGGPAAMNSNDEARQAVQELYQYSTSAVKVEPAEVQRLLAEVEQRLESPSGETARAYERLAAEVQKDQPDGREIRVVASDLYRILADQDA